MSAHQPDGTYRASIMTLIQRLTGLARTLKRFDEDSERDARAVEPPEVPDLTPTGTREVDSVAHTIRAAMLVYERHAERLREAAPEPSPLRNAAGGPALHRVTVLSCEITRLRGSLMKGDPADSLHTLKRYLSLADRIIRDGGGIMHPLNATSFLGIFGLSETDRSRHAVAASRCGLELLAGIDQFNSWQRRHGEVPIRCGIGVHTGPVVIGDVSTRQHAVTGVIGAPVQVATHLHSLADAHVRPLLVSGTTADLIAAELDSSACGDLEVIIDDDRIDVFTIDAPPPHVDYRDLLDDLFPREPDLDEEETIDTAE